MKQSRGFHSERSAERWEEALVTGNGHLGAMVFGHPSRETVILNHSRLYLPLHEPLPPVNQGSILPEIRGRLAEGQYQAAADAVVQKSLREGWGEKRWTDPFIPAFDLVIETEPAGPVQRFRRSVDFATGLISVSWTDGNGDHLRRAFVSKARDLLVVEDAAHGSPVTLRFQTRPTEGTGGWNPAAMFEKGFTHAAPADTGDHLVYEARFARHWPGASRGYLGVGRVTQNGQALAAADGRVSVAGKGKCLIVVALDLAVDADFGYLAERLERQVSSCPPDFETLLREHVAVVDDSADRCGLDLVSEPSGLPAETLLAAAKAGDVPAELLQLQVDAARYAIRSSTGDRYPNLQGIWTGTFSPPWSGDFTLNGNVQCALSANLSGNQVPLLLPFFADLEKHMGAFRENAVRLFGCRGIHVPSRMSTHGLNNHFDGTWPMTFWTAGAPWCAHFFFDYVRYTGDLEFLRTRALPFMTEAGMFFEDFLVPRPDGFLQFSPSYSPENHPGNSESQSCVDAAMEIGAVRILMEELLEAEALLGASTPNPRWQGILDRLPPHLYDDGGAVKEWNTPLLTENNAHRHASHLYEVYDTMGPRIARDPTLRRGLRQALENRMAVRRTEGGGIMAFGMVQLGLSAAVLGDGDAAFEAATWLSKHFWNRNLVSTHDPGKTFNTDICGGFPAILFKMLADRQGDRVCLLPAMAKGWKDGKAHGIRLRGRLVVEEISWGPGEVSATLLSEIDQGVLMGCGVIPADLDEPAGEKVFFKAGERQSVRLQRRK